MTKSTLHLTLLFVAALALILLAACSKTEGKQFDGKDTPDDLKQATCHFAADCGSGRYCKKDPTKDSDSDGIPDDKDDDAVGLCYAQCYSDASCFYLDTENYDKWLVEKAKGVKWEDFEPTITMNLHCSECGTCIPKAVLTDPTCGPVANTACREDSTCAAAALSGTEAANNICHPAFQICTLGCDSDSDCEPLAELHGYHYGCTDFKGKKYCQEKQRETVFCDSDLTCTKFLGDGFVCSSDGVCAYSCNTPWVFQPAETRNAAEQECTTKMGEGYQCQNDGNRKVCQRYCLDDTTCAYWGYTWKCVLPDGVDGRKNFFSTPQNTTYGYCAPRDTVDYGTNVDTTKDNYKFVGVYAGLNESTFQNCGFPIINCQDSTNIHHQLFKVYQGKDDSGNDSVVMVAKYCRHEMENFTVNPKNRTMDDTKATDYAWMEVPKRYTMHIDLHHWNIEMSDVKDVKEGQEFWTDWYPEARGALFTEGENPALATTADHHMPANVSANGKCSADYTEDGGPGTTLTEKPEPADCLQWDQDRDDRPGVTTLMNGMLQGEVYTDNRAFQRAKMTIVKIDDQGRVNKVSGLLQTDNESHVIGATKASFILDAKPVYYKDWERSYVRMVRVPDSADCNDVIRWGASTDNCGGDMNKRVISADEDFTYICHTPTVNGPTDTPNPVEVVAPPTPQTHK